MKRIFNLDKTVELAESEIDYEKGYLKDDKRFVAHHDATPFIKGKTVEEKVEEARANGTLVLEIGNNYYTIIGVYPNGSQKLAEIKADADTPAQEARDDFEDIYVFVPYTEEELKDRQIASLRARREVECFSVINRGKLWYEFLTDEQHKELKAWYSAWLNVTDTLVVPDRPEWLR